MTDPGDATLAAYEAAAERYLQTSVRPGPAVIAHLDRLIDLVGTGHVLELGSGPGWDAEHLASRGLRVTRTDATPAFVELLRAAGHDALLLDVRAGVLGGPYDAILANAVLLHLSRQQFGDVLQRAREAVHEGGVLAFTLKEGDGSGWSEAKLGLPRHFTYWREAPVRDALTRTGWTVVSCDHIAGREEPWLFVLARARAQRAATDSADGAATSDASSPVMPASGVTGWPGATITDMSTAQARPRPRPRPRRLALVTGAGRRVGIAAACVDRLARDGFDVAWTYWSDYDARMPWGTDPDATSCLLRLVEDVGSAGYAIEADLASPDAAAVLFDAVLAAFGRSPTCLVLCHAESVDSGLMDTTNASFDLHYAVNVRATWSLLREFGLRFEDALGTGRVVAMTSDHTVGNLPYGATKGGLDRIVIAAARELAHLQVSANVINPGATDTGWMDADLVASVTAATPLGRVGQPTDVANLVSFLCSDGGGWVNGQLLMSNGGAA